MSWLWIVLVLILSAMLLWWLFSSGEDEADSGTEAVTVEESVDIADRNSIAGVVGEMTLAAILASPSAYYGREGFTGEVTVGGPLTDRGFWIENERSRMFATVIDQPAERPVDIIQGPRCVSMAAPCVIRRRLPQPTFKGMREKLLFAASSAYPIRLGCWTS